MASCFGNRETRCGGGERGYRNTRLWLRDQSGFPAVFMKAETFLNISNKQFSYVASSYHSLQKMLQYLQNILDRPGKIFTLHV